MAIMTTLLPMNATLSVSETLSSIASTDVPSSPPVPGTSAARTTKSSALETITTGATLQKPKLKLGFKVFENFTEELLNKSSPQFKSFSNRVTTALDELYTKEYGALFNRSVVKSLSRGSIVVDAELIFNNVSSVPTTSSVEASLIQEYNNNTNFSLPLNTSTIVATSVSTLTTSTTTLPTTAVPTTAPRSAAASTAVAPTAAPAPSIAAVSTDVTVTSAAETTTTASTNPPSSSEGTLCLQFILNQTFTADLSNSSSTAYKNLSATAVSEVNRVCQKVYPSTFNRSIFNTFTRGSVVVDMTLVFKDKSSLPTVISATSQLSAGLTCSSTSLNIVPGSVIVCTSTSSSPPHPTVLSLAVLSLTLLIMAQMLTDS
uniref:A-agglutinin anchorage subunit-like isoform X2 n=1 Tax=Epinephelus lanceolatus TaxID=310571 RepID=UPI001447183A|nr:A-agglutinin anchorage subunit-like isoform X2 [Epinephelus lanceolatus]